MIPLRRFRFLLALSLLGGAAGALRAAEVEVGTVRFANVRAPNDSAANWYEASVELKVKPPAGPGRVVSRVRVTLLLVCEIPGGTVKEERRREYYRSSAECIALEAGSAQVRFYLPPELVRRDRLQGDPKYWAVEIAIGGQIAPDMRGNFSASLPTADSRKNFRSEAVIAAAPNDGVLQPQFLTPFVNAYPRSTPSYLRKEMR